MDLLMTKEVTRVMSVPWIREIGINKAFDSSTTITLTFYALRREYRPDVELCQDLAKPYGMYFEENFQKYGVKMDLYLSSVRVRPVTLRRMTLSASSI